MRKTKINHCTPLKLRCKNQAKKLVNELEGYELEVSSELLEEAVPFLLIGLNVLLVKCIILYNVYQLNVDLFPKETLHIHMHIANCISVLSRLL